MRIIAFITGASATRDLLVHLGKTSAPPRIAPLAGRRCRTRSMPGLNSTFTPSRHRSTSSSSINASLGSPGRRPPFARNAGQARAADHQARPLTLVRRQLDLPEKVVDARQTLAKPPMAGNPGAAATPDHPPLPVGTRESSRAML